MKTRKQRFRFMQFIQEARYVLSKQATIREKARWLKEQSNKLAHLSVWADAFLSAITAILLSYKKDLIVQNQYIDLTLHLNALQQLASKIILIVLVGYMITFVSMKISEHYDRVLTERANGRERRL